MSDNPPMLSSKPLTRGQRMALSTILATQRQAQEQILISQIRKLHKTLVKRLAGASSETQRDQAVSEYAEGYGKAVERMLIRLYPLINQMMKGEKCVPGMEIKGISSKFRKWMDKYLANKITFVGDTTKANVRKWYSESSDYNAFEQKLSSHFSAKRAENIGRTEYGFASQVSMNQIAHELSFGQKLEKTWQSAYMSNSRPFHTEMDGVTIPSEEKFKVNNPNGGYNMMNHPCDPNAPPEQVCRCRCNCFYTLVGLKKF